MSGYRHANKVTRASYLRVTGSTTKAAHVMTAGMLAVLAFALLGYEQFAVGQAAWDVNDALALVFGAGLLAAAALHLYAAMRSRDQRLALLPGNSSAAVTPA